MPVMASPHMYCCWDGFLLAFCLFQCCFDKVFVVLEWGVRTAEMCCVLLSGLLSKLRCVFFFRMGAFCRQCLRLAKMIALCVNNECVCVSVCFSSFLWQMRKRLCELFVGQKKRKKKEEKGLSARRMRPTEWSGSSWWGKSVLCVRRGRW